MFVCMLLFLLARKEIKYYILRYTTCYITFTLCDIGNCHEYKNLPVFNDGLIMHVCFKYGNTILNSVLTVGICKFNY